jgi:hypothetical protein
LLGSGRPLDDDCQGAKRNKQQRQQKEHVGEGHDHPLAMDDLHELLQCHGLSIAAIAVQIRREVVQRLDRGPPLRTVIGIADRMPKIGRRFYETGPASGIARVARYLEDQVTAGVLSIEDCELAAAQFLDSCQSMTFKPLLFNATGRPSDARIEHVVATAVRTFLAGYRR